MSRLAVFAYASLVSPASAGETLGRTIDGLVPARLEGFSRGWTLGRDNLRSEKTFARADGSLPRFCLGLNLERADEGPRPPNGALVEVTKAELERLDVREIRYRRIDVTEAIVAQAGAALDAIHRAGFPTAVLGAPAAAAAVAAAIGSNPRTIAMAIGLRSVRFTGRLLPSGRVWRGSRARPPARRRAGGAARPHPAAAGTARHPVPR